MRHLSKHSSSGTRLTCLFKILIKIFWPDLAMTTSCFEWLFNVGREENVETFLLVIKPEGADANFEKYTLEITRREKELLFENDYRKILANHTSLELLRAHIFEIIGRRAPCKKLSF